ncbi:MAG: elongation factor P [Candidatus Woesebacteria bacterium GW2011_GWA1_37_8]|uniref:Elongation factor P n=2 Tax=Candidatus Woeseibacteriota TaxID=1752722 RepID=A0A0G0PCX7_9BACT|nr:MAG: elongation factor P [Microgenomates group bacterium GW2011_GWC1_37_12b]KKQ45299.1 MAG: elongation factor P [Candidatus Woesebacteria bacterium GW2011_GWA1_37_8]KKQ87101.1 MAG: elongation factor P [Candidatus Woesebacteria bacterium GW2011_GWB1_38_8b]
MIASTSLRAGVTFLANDKPYRVIKYLLVKQGRGGATVRVTVRNLESGGVEEKTYSSNVKVEDISTQKRQLQYLYSDGSNVMFMDPRSYDQVEVPLKTIEDDIKYIKEGQTVSVLFWEEKALGIEIQPKIILEITDTPPGVKGNSASNIYKTAKLENGITTKVPLFINTGEKIVVDTRTGEYVERAK